MDEDPILIAALDDQLVQEFRTCQAILAVVKEERLALASHDAESLSATAEQIEALLDELMNTEEKHCTVIQELSRKFHLDIPNPTLSEIASALNPEEGSRIKRLQEGCLALACEIRELTNGNLVLAASSLRVVDLVDGNGNQMYDTGTNRGNPTPEIILHSVGPGQKIPQNLNDNLNFSPLFTAHIASRNELDGRDSPTIQTAAGSFQDALKGARPARTASAARQNGNRLEKAQSEVKGLLSQKEDAYPPEAILALRSPETVYQVVVEVGNRAISAMNLFEQLS